MPQKKLLNLPKVALIGRTNVGKSTLFNKMTEEKGALVSDIAGTTRDRKFGEVLWLGQTFLLIDTAGLDVSTEKEIDVEAVKQAHKAAAEADVIVFMVDARDGMLIQDREYAKMLKKQKIPVILVANKVDSNKQLSTVSDFYKLNLGDPLAVSATTGSGTGDLLDLILQKLKTKLARPEISNDNPQIKIAIIGKPNVGKSSLLNKLAGEERVIVSDLPHTTRDSQDITLEVDYQDKKYNLKFIDTAGIRKKRKIDKTIERFSVDQSVKNLKKCDIALLVLDIAHGISIQDKHIAMEILDNNKSVIIVVNKWDLVEDKSIDSAKKYTLFVHRHFPFLTWVPIIFISAKTGAKVDRLLKTIFEVHEKQNLVISDKQLEKFIKYLVKHQSPRQIKGNKPPYLHSLKQTKTNPQTFDLSADQPENIHFAYMRYLINELRERFALAGVGVKVHTVFPKKKRKL